MRSAFGEFRHADGINLHDGDECTEFQEATLIETAKWVCVSDVAANLGI
jgi:hypothetical protein